jgi:hypothetical protein
MTSRAEARLEQLIDRVRAAKLAQICLDAPDHCSICHAEFTGHRFMVDGEIRGTPQVTLPGGETAGQWGYMCAQCFYRHGYRVIWGRGQLYERTAEGDWLLVAGFPPE